jgi:hypothetical protein
MNREIKILILIIVISIIFAVLAVISHLSKSVKKLNTSVNTDREVNELAFPLIKNNKKYIQKQTEEWYRKRSKGEPCYAVLEKDKIIMSKWMEMADVRGAKIHYYAYHDQFSKDDLQRIVQENKDKHLIVKISHLQSSFGIIKIPAKSSPKEVDKIYNQILNKFNTSFVCNHDSNDPPTNKQIKDGKKPSYYKLYETIKPGVIIQDYFESYLSSSGSPEWRGGMTVNGVDITSGRDTPIEIKILMFGDRVINVGLINIISVYMNRQRYQPLFDEARKISNFLGATLVRVDFFVKKEDDPYVPYLNEISLSPNRGINKAAAFSNEEINEMKKEIENSPRGKYDDLNKLIEECPFRELPIERYMTDAETRIIWEEKY